MQRMGWVIGIRPDMVQTYKTLHAEVWPSVLQTISRCNIRNYTIYLREPENLLFGTFEYHGSDYDGDMARMADDPETQKWWALTDPCQVPLASAGKGVHWAPMEEVFHSDVSGFS